MNNNNLNLVVMLTHNDHTVPNAEEIYAQCEHSQAQFWGFKEKPLPIDTMKRLFKRMKNAGKTTFLEVVEYTEAEGLAGAKTALECGCDILMGTKFHDSINAFCQQNGLKYMPFVGELAERPTVLSGGVSDIIAEAQRYEAKGVYGIDLLGYRYVGDAAKLNAELVRSLNIPVCIAGSVNSYQRLDELKAAQPWAFTIGSAFFDNQFSGSMAEQIDTVCDYMRK
ncbi:hypothetical protein QEO94_08980 [Kingella negevensis]|uniref:hypothetical protein n=1 Tax=Kingella negevensis TaxID=1522312 RepID=UPI002543B368|nr:hypothetical protein [Kingella negevensis]MDK4680522.1 hypothetical protein [Kingella negevensis]MDK4681755.1 hypothetical protein [Kingella negevensis]MDK4689953.1 hypothetical protein [Kingella negevensis]MDK4692703.1 hypothetical protein [Kingella negevensis]MDK4699002.1 hypothetical protein [Kingella negevensis]